MPSSVLAKALRMDFAVAPAREDHADTSRAPAERYRSMD